MRDAHRRPSSGRGPASLVTELDPAEKAAALSQLGKAAPPGAPLDAGRLDAARARLRAAVAPPSGTAPPPTSVDPAAFVAAQARLRAGAPVRGTRRPKR